MTDTRSTGRHREPRGQREPIPTILHCPECRARHVDTGEFATKHHHTHSCQSCGLTWRPAVVATVGVQFLPGFKDTPAPEQREKPRTRRSDNLPIGERPAAAVLDPQSEDDWDGCEGGVCKISFPKSEYCEKHDPMRRADSEMSRPDKSVIGPGSHDRPCPCPIHNDVMPGPGETVDNMPIDHVLEARRLTAEGWYPMPGKDEVTRLVQVSGPEREYQSVSPAVRDAMAAIQRGEL